MDYQAHPTTHAFHHDSSFVRGLIGPIGSGKSVACCFEGMFIAMNQEPNAEGIRKTRGVIIRNTYRELLDTTIKTWNDWFPEDLGTWHKQDLTHVIEQKLSDGTIMHMEVLFRALDRPNDVKKLLSLELTWAWVNEAREIPRAVIDMLQGRVGRYPSKRDGGASWFGVFMDTNPPDTDHWWYRLFEEDQPDGWALFHQPSGVSEQAENIDNLPSGYYIRMQAGKDQQWIDVYVHGKYGFVMDGKPVYPEYNDNVHILKTHPKPLRGDIYIGLDFGLTPAAVMAQRTAQGQWLVIDELVSEDMGAARFGQNLKKLLNERYPGNGVKIWGDPAGEQRAQTDEQTPFKIMRAAGIPAVPAPTNDFTLRREAVVRNLSTLTMSGQPALMISSRCKQLRKGMAGGYKFKRIQVSGDERYQDKPDKNMYSHVCEALQYLMVGGGESNQVIRSSFNQKPKVNRTIKARRRA